MSQSYAVSVVMPTLNQAPFIASSIASVLSQEDVAVELIVMDGGSTDGTQALLSELEAAYGSRLRWYSEKDEGPADAVNKAIGLATAPIIGWLNSDDLYARGAIRRAVDHMAAHSNHAMVYGQGHHVDVNGDFIEVYPTLPPSVPFAYFGDGCFICQPTAFFRKGVWDELGGLDRSFKAAFDFEFWLRIFRAWPLGVGFVDSLQAYSRLHAGGITLRFRERVALESIQAIRCHVGAPPAHWLLTCLEEYCPQHPFQAEGLGLSERFERLMQRAAPFLSSTVMSELRRRAAEDRRVQLSGPFHYVGVHSDGWAPADLQIRLIQMNPPVRRIQIRCCHRTPFGGQLRMKLLAPGQGAEYIHVDGNGEFDLEWSVHDQSEGAMLVFSIETEGGFVPAEVEPGSVDRRKLAFLVDEIVLK